MAFGILETSFGFDSFFRAATGGDKGYAPYPFQRRFAISKDLPEILVIPTGMGKTDAVILGWLWRRRFDPQTDVRAATPRRLVYCLPMRVLVEQTEKKAKEWLKNLGLLAENGPGSSDPVEGWAAECGSGGDRIAVTVLMGGEDKDEWDLYPERDAIIIGTQDMLLSRALNRGYGMSRYRWPLHFGLLNNDCLWVMDEVQLMGRGLTTSAQLQAFRGLLGTIHTPAKTIWMSATLERPWLETVDFERSAKNLSVFSLSSEDIDSERIESRRSAKKILNPASSATGDPKELAVEILQKHHPGTRTLVVLNTVRRAADLYAELKKMNPSAHLIIVHSHFRPPDRKKIVEDLLRTPGESGTIVVSTQVVEAGVDISARTLFTELAPWSSLIQRFGRCNRSGEFLYANVYWLDLPTGKKSLALPYSDNELDQARKILLNQVQKSVGPASLPKIPLSFVHEHVIRRKDMLGMFDTTLDLAGHDLDISRFIREISDTDAQVFWRNISGEAPSEDEPDYHRDELCSVRLSDIRNLIRKGIRAWTWDSLEGNWMPLKKSSPLLPGMVIMLHAIDGCYTPSEGWNPQSKASVPVIIAERRKKEKYSDNLLSSSNWQTIA
ncbi:CRISPR-associated helicase Cas3', partial [Methanothrix sp.]